MKTKTILKIVVMLVIFIALALIGTEMFGWFGGAAAAVGIGGVIALIVFRGAKFLGGGGSGGGGGGVG